MFAIFQGFGSYTADNQLHQCQITERLTGGKWGHHSTSLKVKVTERLTGGKWGHHSTSLKVKVTVCWLVKTYMYKTKDEK